MGVPKRNLMEHQLIYHFTKMFNQSKLLFVYDSPGNFLIKSVSYLTIITM